MTKIHIVEGRGGSYSDYMEWQVKAFIDKKNAQKLCDKLNKIVNKHGGDLLDDVLREELKKAGDNTEYINPDDMEYIVFDLEIADLNEYIESKHEEWSRD